MKEKIKSLILKVLFRNDSVILNVKIDTITGIEVKGSSFIINSEFSNFENVLKIKF